MPQGLAAPWRRPDVYLAGMTPQNVVQLVAGILCVVLIVIVILRRKGKKKHQEDEF
jgi:hypothetical protein